MNPLSNPSFPVFEVFLGDVKPLPLKALYQTTLGPLDLTDCSEIVVNLPNADGTFLQLKLSLDQVTITSPSVLGQFVANFTSIQSALFMVGTYQNIDVTFTISGAPQTVRFMNCFSVFQVD